LKMPGRVPGLVESKIIEFGDSSILKNVVDFGKINKLFEDHYQLNYFTAKKWDSVIYCVHYSDIINKTELDYFDEKSIFLALDKGFKVNLRSENP